MKYGLGIIISLIICLLSLSPQPVFAHASLTNASPSQNEHLKTSPDRIQLEFNERLEHSQYYIDLYDSNGKKVNAQKAKLSQNQRSITLDLPDELGEGSYVVTYHVISADGHPVEETYPFTIGTNESNAISDSLIESEHQHGGMLYWLFQSVYYVILLLLAGWLFWGNVSDVSHLKEAFRKWLMRLKLIFLFMISCYGFARLLTLIREFRLDNIVDVVLHTTVGIVWMIMLALSVLGYFLLGRMKWFDWIWPILILGAEACYGHAITFTPQWYTLSFDFIHLAAASIWISGLFMLYLRKKVTGTFITPFTKQFSDYAFLSIIFLIVSGSLLSLRFVPNISFLLQTTWGYLLLIKIFFVLVIVLMGYLLRTTLAKNDENTFSKRLEWDFAIMFAIIFLVAMLSSLSPTPENEALDWSETEHGIHMNLEITPNRPGKVNALQLTLKGVGEGIDPGNTFIKLIPLDKPSVTPVQVPLELQAEHDNNYIYEAKGNYLAWAGDWKVIVSVRDDSDQETTFEDTFKLFPNN